MVLVTSGPGAGNTITGIMTARMDSVPMIIVSGQQVTWMLGKDAFQEADIFGISVGQTLRVYSDAMRTKRSQRAEEKAAKLPVLLLLPLVIFILPSLFIAILGPAVMIFIDLFAKLPS